MKPGPRPIPNSPLPWTGDFEDGLGNLITMHAYANPEDRNNELKRADGFGVARFDKKNEPLPLSVAEICQGFGRRQSSISRLARDIKMTQNDGRNVMGWLPKLSFSNQTLWCR